jgi:sporulation protein YlmC with PRC-barrel domain
MLSLAIACSRTILFRNDFVPGAEIHANQGASIMRKSSIAVAVAALLSVGLSTPLWADSMSTDKDIKTDRMMPDTATHPNNQAMENSASTPNTAAIELKDYKGKEVITSTGDSVGKIGDLVTNNLDHTVYAIVGVGGFLGLGEKEAAIPVTQLQSQGDKWVLSSGVTKDSLKKQRKYEESEFSAFEPTDQPSGD